MNFFGQLGSWILKKKKIQEILQGHFPGTISISSFYSSKPNQHPLQTPYPQQASFIAIGCFHLQLAPFLIIKSFQTTCQYSIAPSQEGLIISAQLSQRHLNEAYFFKTFGYEQGKQAGWLVDHMQFGNANLRVLFVTFITISWRGVMWPHFRGLRMVRKNVGYHYHYLHFSHIPSKWVPHAWAFS